MSVETRRRKLKGRAPGTQPPPAPRSRFTLEEFRAKALALGGGDKWAAKFRCVMCGNEASGLDWVALSGKEDSAARAPQECIGRLHNELRTPGVKVGRWGKGKPCDWAAFGLFGAPGGVTVLLPDGKEIDAFPFVEPQP
jgi:hypothetical protein